MSHRLRRLLKLLTNVCPLLTEMFDKQQANSIFWSPQGQFLVLAGLRRSVKSVFVCVFRHLIWKFSFLSGLSDLRLTGLFTSTHKSQFFWCVSSVYIKASLFLCVCSMNGALAFVDTSDCTMMNIAEHYMASDVEWDPTGRYVVTSVSWWSHKVNVAAWRLKSSSFSFLSGHLTDNWLESHSELMLTPFVSSCMCVSRWTTHTGCGRSRAVCCRRTTRTASVSCSGDPGPPPCSV